jgi:hypothetical protein
MTAATEVTGAALTRMKRVALATTTTATIVATHFSLTFRGAQHDLELWGLGNGGQGQGGRHNRASQKDRNFRSGQPHLGLRRGVSHPVDVLSQYSPVADDLQSEAPPNTYTP